MGVAKDGIRPPGPVSVLAHHQQRIEELERPLPPQQQPRPARFEVAFDFAGLLSAGESDEVPLRDAGRLNVVAFRAKTPGTTDTTVRVYRNGVALTPSGAGATLIHLAAGSANVQKVFFDQLFSPDSDTLRVAVITPGTGASGLFASCRFGS
jgi:hypothetical protein